jgi:hypothetical protein
MHDHLEFWKVRARWVTRELKARKKTWTKWACPRNISYGMQLKEKTCLTGLLLGSNHGRITSNPNQSLLQCNRNIPVHLQQKSSKLKVTPSGEKFLLAVFWDSQGVVLAHFKNCGEDWKFSSYCEVLLKLRGAICIKRPGQLARGILLHQTMPDPIQPEQPRGEFNNYSGNFLNIRLTARTWHLVTSIYLVRQRPPWYQTLRWWWRGWNGGEEMADTTVKKLLRCGFRRTGKQWDKCIYDGRGYVKK